MLTPRQNLIETLCGGKPDRYVKQFEAIATPWSDPFSMSNAVPLFPGDDDKKDLWGVTWSWPKNVPGMFPVHEQGLKVIPDIETWDGTLQVPTLDYSEEMWESARKDYAQYDRNEVFVGPIMFPGLFEQTHCLLGMDSALEAFYSEPEKMHQLIEQITDWNASYAKLLTEKLHIDALVQHDDWGSSLNTIMSPAMFKEFYLEPYKRLYKTYKDGGVQVIIHHSDCYAATLVPFMIEMGIDIWQGGTGKNNIPALIQQYGERISFMTGFNAEDVDHEGWSKEQIQATAKKVCTECGNKYFIPCQTGGGPFSVYDGVYDAINAAIDEQSAHMFA